MKVHVIYIWGIFNITKAYLTDYNINISIIYN